MFTANTNSQPKFYLNWPHYEYNPLHKVVEVWQDTKRVGMHGIDTSLGPLGPQS